MQRKVKAIVSRDPEKGRWGSKEISTRKNETGGGRWRNTDSKNAV